MGHRNNETPTTMNTYATIRFNGSKTYTVVMSCGTCVFATQSKRKAENFLARILKCANAQ